MPPITHSLQGLFQSDCRKQAFRPPTIILARIQRVQEPQFLRSFVYLTAQRNLGTELNLTKE
ncbi:unnamed protein product [Ceratitis capitata]|uniref:(Mediterranean fruit fly) hypothetical protein n=1 Tax=Ceratitis capitata TaxID=7213 RepID=A0A811UYU1_CERCA|nr:unnamed protein product [Ceratitis capitata]